MSKYSDDDGDGHDGGDDAGYHVNSWWCKSRFCQICGFILYTIKKIVAL